MHDVSVPLQVPARPRVSLADSVWLLFLGVAGFWFLTQWGEALLEDARADSVGGLAAYAVFCGMTWLVWRAWERSAAGVRREPVPPWRWARAGAVVAAGWLAMGYAEIVAPREGVSRHWGTLRMGEAYASLTTRMRGEQLHYRLAFFCPPRASCPAPQSLEVYLLDEEGDSTMFTRVRADSLWSREARLESLTGERKILEWERAGYRQGTGWAVRPQYSSFR